MKIVAILSTTVIPLDGTYSVERLESIPVIKGVSHYIGHPDTKAIVESLGAVQSESKLFSGLEPGESAICFAIKQGKSSRANEGFTSPHQEVNIDDIDIRVITRSSVCIFCKQDSVAGWYCGNCGAS